MRLMQAISGNDDTRPTEVDRVLRTYLDDHRAGSAAGLAVARRLADRYGAEPGYEALPGLAREVAHDRDQLEAILDRHGGGGRWKQPLALIVERARRLKHLDVLRTSRDLSRLEELEELAAGVYAKERLWESLAAVEGSYVGEVDVAELRERAEAQMATLESLHRRAATDALSTSV